MIANLYKNNSDRIVLNKSLTLKTEMDIALIDPVDWLHPRLKLSALSNFPEANYMWLPDWGRYYFINNDEFAHKIGYIQCDVDPFMSFKDFILQTEILVDRGSVGNTYLPDAEIMEYAQPYMQTFNINRTKGVNLDMDTNEIILGITGAV